MKDEADLRSSGRLRRIPRDELVIATLACLAADPAALQAFVDLTGQSPQGLRQGIADGTAQAGVLHALAHDDALILAVAHASGRRPEDVAQAAQVYALPDPSDDHF